MSDNSNSSSGPPSPVSRPQSPSLHLTGPSPLPTTDADIAHALVAWLISLSAVPSVTTFEHIVTNCAPLNEVVSQIAPTLLPPTDILRTLPSIGANVARNRRYNIRRLVRALVAFFRLRTDRPVCSSSSAASDLSSASEDALSSSPDCDVPPAFGTSLFLPRLNPRYAFTLITLSNSTCTEHSDSFSIILTLAECTLCAATNCRDRENYIQAVLRLPRHMQDLLAVSINRAMLPSQDIIDPVAPRAPLHDSVLHNDENRSAVPQLHNDERLVPPSGIPLSDYKTLASERDALRRKVNALLAETTQLRDVEFALRKDLEDTRDQNRIIDSRHSNMELELASKNRKLSDAEYLIRDAKIKAEEFEVLRIKALEVDELEASLKRVNERLEEMNNVRDLNKELEAQIQAFRENEDRLGKQTEYLENQLERTTERTNQLSALLNELNAEMEDKDAKIAASFEENVALKEKILMLNSQLELGFQQSASTSKAGTSATNRSQLLFGNNIQAADQSIPQADGRPTAPELQSGTTGTQSAESEDPSVETTSKAPSHVNEQYDRKAKQYVSDLLLDAIGVRVRWEDIVECMRGVMDAMRDMEKSAEMEHRAAAASLSVPESPLTDRVAKEQSRASSDAIRRLRSLSGTTRCVRNSQISVRSDGRVESGSDALSRLDILPEFEEVDEKFKAKNPGKGDEFDHAANLCNVREIRIGGMESTDDVQSDDYDHESSYTGSGTYGAEDDEQCEGENGAAGVHSSSMYELDRSKEARKTSDLTLQQAWMREGATAQSEWTRSNDSDMMITSQGGSMSVMDGKRTTSMSLTVRGADSRSTSHSRSETTSIIARQTRRDLQELRRTMEVIRLERQSCSSVTALVQRLEGVRAELETARKKTLEADAESATLRRELNVLLKEMDNTLMEKNASEERGRKLSSDKDKLICHLEASLHMKEAEVNDLRSKYEESQRDYDKLKEEEKMVQERLDSAIVIEKAHEVEIAKLRAKLEAQEDVEMRLKSVVRQTEGLTDEVKRHHDNHMNEILETMRRRDKEFVEKTRQDAHRVIMSNESILEDLRANAAAMALARNGSTDDRSGGRRSTRFYEFWRKLLHKDRIVGDFSSPAVFSSSSRTEGLPTATTTPRAATIATPRSHRRV